MDEILTCCIGWKGTTSISGLSISMVTSIWSMLASFAQVSVPSAVLHDRTVLMPIQIRDYGGLIQHISHVLRPGGLIDLLEYDFQVHNEHRQLVTVSTGSMGAPWLPRFLTLIKNAAGRRGGTLDAARNLYNWVKDTPAFTDVVHRQIWTPASPWLTGSDPETQKLNQHGALMRDDVMVGPPLALGSLNSMLMSFCTGIFGGRPTPFTEQWITGTIRRRNPAK